MKDLLNIFKALSEETRLRILKLLEHGELCVCDIVAALGMVQPKVSFHLNVLKEAGFLKDKKQGRWTYYSLDTTDLLKRMLMVSVCENADGSPSKEDRKRLSSFVKSGRVGTNCACSRKKGAARTDRKKCCPTIEHHSFSKARRKR